MLKLLFNLLFPRLCNGCNTLLLKNEMVICTLCRHEIPLTNHHFTENNEIEQKFYGIIPIEYASAMTYFHHKGIVQNLIHNLKYRNQQEIGTTLGNWYAEELKKSDRLPKFDYIIPTPLHSKRLKERGYNQIDTFCKALSEELNVVYDKKLLIRNKYSKSQTKKGLEKRSEVLSNVFETISNSEHENKHFLLVDDVITTGATIESCAKALLKIPNSRISIISIAYTQS